MTAVRELIERLVEDSLDRSLPRVTRREARLPGLPGKADAVIGMRRSGKTFFLYQCMSDLIEAGTPRDALLYFSFEDERLRPLTAADLHLVPDAYFRARPESRRGTVYFFFDEIQNVPGWESFIRRLLDTENVRIDLSGSSARLLGRDVATSLRGRSIATEMYPFSLSEYLAHHGIDPGNVARAPSRQRALLQNRFRKYLLTGGFPEIQGLDDDLRVRVLQRNVDVVILRDVMERHGVTSMLPLRLLTRHALAAPAALFSVNKFHRDLQSRGVACARNTLYELLEYLEDAFLLFKVPLHSRSERVRRANPVKLFTIDTGLAAAFAHQARPDLGYLFENLVFLHLRRCHPTIAYYRTRGGRPIDFLVTTVQGELSLVQATVDMTASATRQREVTALAEAMEELKLRTGTIVTLEDEETIGCSAGTIRVVPAWRWCLTPVGDDAEPLVGSRAPRLGTQRNAS